MLKKEDFCHFIKFIEEKQESIFQFNKLFRQEFEDSCIYPYSKYETEMVKLLELSMEVDKDSDWVPYFIYELNFGKDWKPGYITDENGADIKL